MNATTQSQPHAEKQSRYVTFHDRNIGREHRYLVDGKVVLLEGENADREMLYAELCTEVEEQIAQGKTEGFTACPLYPEWRLTTMH